MAYRQRWAEYFSLLDADGSGALSSDDIVGGVQVIIYKNKYTKMICYIF